MRKKILIFSLIWFLSLIFGACSQKFSLTKAPLDISTYQISLSGDTTSVNITKLGKLNLEQFSWWNAELSNNEIRYEARIPELSLKFQFPMQNNLKVDQIIKDRHWIESWAIQIPYNSDDETFLSSQIIVFSAPWLSSWSSLKEVGKVYKHLYEDIYMLKDWRDYEIKRREGYEKSPDRHLSEEQKKEWDSFLSYISSWGNLLLWTGNKWYWASWYLPFDWFWEKNRFQHKEASKLGWEPIKNIENKQEKRRGKSRHWAMLRWNKHSPKYFFLIKASIIWWRLNLL